MASRLTPLNSVESMMRADFTRQLGNSSCREFLSELLTVPLTDCTPSSRMRCSMLPDFVQRAFCRLQQRDAVVGVAVGLLEATDLRREALRDCQTGGVVFGAVDAQTRRQTLQRWAMLDCEFIRTRCELIGHHVVLITCAISFLP